MKIELINHACVKIHSKRVCILADPWLDGTAFNEGWRHLVETPFALPRFMDGVTHIWLSHEHPDHFSPRFFFSIAKEYAPRVEVLFQKTRDGRVKRFVEARGFRVREIDKPDLVQLEDCEIRVGRHGFYDSWLLVRDSDASVLNLNDCPLRSGDELKPLKRLVRDVDVLLTQFSYAAWKGGRDHVSYRREAAREKLATIRKQIETLGPRSVVPFASMIYFSNVENCCLNDSINTPKDAAHAIAEAGADPVVLFPGDSWEVGQPHSNEIALSRYGEVYAGLSTLPLDGAGESIDIVQLAKRFEKYRERVYAKNSPFFVRLARMTPLGGVFRAVSIRLVDIDTTVSVSIVDGFRTDDGASAEISMHSSSLAFIFDHEFGFDTLTVNGRFEANPKGFSKMVGAFGIGSLNAMGVSLSLSIFRHVHIIVLLMRMLARVMRRLQGYSADRISGA